MYRTGNDYAWKSLCTTGGLVRLNQSAEEKALSRNRLDDHGADAEDTRNTDHRKYSATAVKAGETFFSPCTFVISTPSPGLRG